MYEIKRENRQNVKTNAANLFLIAIYEAAKLFLSAIYEVSSLVSRIPNVKKLNFLFTQNLSFHRSIWDVLLKTLALIWELKQDLLINS